MTTDKTDKKQSQAKPWQFSPGQSGNPSGRPKGSRNKTTLALQALLDGEGEAITRQAVELAKMGDITAIKLVMERILPARKDHPVIFDLPDIHDVQGVTDAQAALVQAVSVGDLTPHEAQQVAALLEQLRKAIETTELLERIEKLEAKR